MPTNFPGTGFLPVITITKNDASTYVFNPFTGSNDFRPQQYLVKPPSDNVAGTFELMLYAGSNSSMRTFLSNVNRGNEILFEIGKTDASKVKVLRGVIHSIEGKEESSSYTVLTIKGQDWGSEILKNRIVTGYWEQLKDPSDSTKLDPTDNNVLVEQIAKDLLQQLKALAVQDVTPEQMGIVVNSANFKNTGIRLANFACNYEKLADKLDELDGIAGTVHRVDPDKIFYMQSPQYNFTDVLLTDDANDSQIPTFGNANVGYIQPGSTWEYEISNTYRRIFGLGGINDRHIDVSQESISAGSQAIDNKYYAVKFTPTKSAGSKIAIFLSRDGTPTNGLFVELREDASNTPNGSAVFVWNKPAVAVNTTAEVNADNRLGWHFFQLNQNDQLNTAKSYWIVVRPANTVSSPSNIFRWYYGNVTGTIANSTNGSSWTVTSSSPTTYAFMYYDYVPVTVIYPNTPFTITTKHPWEQVFSKPDITDQDVLSSLITAESSTLTKEKLILNLNIISPDVLLKNDDVVLVRKQQSGLLVDDVFVVTDIQYSGNADQKGTIGEINQKITCSQFYDYA